MPPVSACYQSHAAAMGPTAWGQHSLLRILMRRAEYRGVGSTTGGEERQSYPGRRITGRIRS